MKKTIRFILVTTGLLFYYNTVTAQISGGSLFLQGNYVEVGIAANGSWGPTGAPAGYHPYPAGSGLAMVYDYGHDGWTVGTPPYYGDYTYPGTPFEGWSIQVNGVRRDAFYTTGGSTGTSFTAGLTGSNTSYTNTGSSAIGVWQGTAGGLNITQTTRIDANASWAVVTTVLANSTAATIPDVYYWRTCDGDNDETRGGSFTTTNTIVYQNDAFHRVMVSATGNTHTNAYMALGTKDCRAKSMIYVSWSSFPALTAGNSLDKIYNQTATGLGTTYYGLGQQTVAQDIAIGLIFNIGSIAAGDSAVISYAYMFGNDATTTLANATTAANANIFNATIDSIFPSTGTGTACVASPISGVTNLCAGQVSALSDSTAGGIWSSNNVTIASVSGTGSVTGIAAGTAVITYSIGGPCCYTTATVTVSGTPAAITGPLSVCTGSTITLSDNPAGGTWSSSNPSVATINSGTRAVRGIAAGIAIITYTTGACGTATATITVDPAPSVITGAGSVCIGSSISLSDATPGGTWSSSIPGRATISSGGVVTGLSAGTVTITYTMPGGCISTVAVTVSTTPSISGATSLCTGSTITLLASPAGGTWTSGSPGIATVTSGTGIVSGVSVGTVMITYSIGGSCIATTAITVSAGTYISSGSANVCTNNIITLTNATSGGSWSSSNAAIANVVATGAGTSTVSGISAGAAVITYLVGSCTAYTTTVTVNPAPSVAPGIVSVCAAGGTTTLNGIPGGGTWSSSNPAIATVTSGGVVTGVSSGYATITYYSSGCFATSMVSVTSVTPPITGNTNVCTGQQTALSDAAAPGGIWSSGSSGIATINAGTGIVAGVSAGSTAITYSLGGGCLATATITVYTAPNAGTITGPADLCVNATIILSSTSSGGVWSSSNGFATVSGGVVIAVSAGTDTIRYIVSNASCADTAIKIITVYPAEDAGTITGPSTLCQGSVITLSDDASGGVWSSESPGIATVSAGGIVTGVSAGIVIIKYTVSNPACSDTAGVLVTVYYSPDPGIITGQDTICANAVFALHDTATGGVWSSSNPSAATVDSVTGVVYAMGNGTTTINYTTGANSNGCSRAASFIIVVTAHAPFAISSVVSQITCYGADNGSITTTIIDGNSHLQYIWSNSSVSTGLLSLSGLDTGIYILKVTDSVTQCSAADTFHITQPDSLSVSDSATMDMCGLGTGNIITTVTGGTPVYSYKWTGNGTNSSLQNLLADTYTLTVTDANGCTKIVSVTVGEDTCSNIIVHNAITPNGDGVNDTWVVEGIENYPANTVQIFDKWGDIMYEKANYKNDWGGKGKRGPLPDGTYYYLVKLNAKNETGGKDTFTGYVLIKR